MLKKIKITNFLSCQDTEIEFDDITALIGRNAAGKSNILKILYWVSWFTLGAKKSWEYVIKEKYIHIEFLINDKNFKYTLNMLPSSTGVLKASETFSCYESNKWRKIAERTDSSAIYYYKEEIFEFNINPTLSIIKSIDIFFPKEKVDSSINIIIDYLTGINYYTLEDNDHKNRTGLVSATEYREWLSEKNIIDSSVIMRLLHLWNEDKELLNELREILGKNGLDLINGIIILDSRNISDSNLNQENNFYFINFNVKNNEASYEQLSYGTRRVLILLLALLYDKNSTLLIEQPEDGIHSGLLKKLLPLCFQYAKYYNKQLIITTHSSEVINLFQPENIRLVKMTDNGTKVSPLDKERMPFIHEFIENEGALFDLIDAMDD
jgi:AAA15 family ATPase/GTPase